MKRNIYEVSASLFRASEHLLNPLEVVASFDTDNQFKSHSALAYGHLRMAHTYSRKAQSAQMQGKTAMYNKFKGLAKQHGSYFSKHLAAKNSLKEHASPEAQKSAEATKKDIYGMKKKNHLRDSMDFFAYTNPSTRKDKSERDFMKKSSVAAGPNLYTAQDAYKARQHYMASHAHSTIAQHHTNMAAQHKAAGHAVNPAPKHLHEGMFHKAGRLFAKTVGNKVKNAKNYLANSKKHINDYLDRKLAEQGA